MEYVRLGKSNLMISRVAFGAMSLTKIGDDEKAAAHMINWAKSCIPVLLFQTVAHGWNTRQTPMTFFMFV